MNALAAKPALIACAALLLSACATGSHRKPQSEISMPAPLGRHHADLLTGGLGLDGLRSMTPPTIANPLAPSAEELRLRSLWTNWRGIADLAPGGGYGELYGSLVAVPGREFHALRRVDGATQPHRVMTQVPDAFDAKARCLVVTASSGSRGVYGAIALAGAWGLPRGCAVAYTDKGTGSDWIQLGTSERHGLDGRLGTPSEPAFDPAGSGAQPRVAFKHAHSQDNPEADWGRHLRQAAEFGLEALNAALPAQAPFTFDNTRIIATGLSNGGAAVLRAAELEGDWLDGAVAIAANVQSGIGGRAAFDHATEAALYMPCALLHPRFDGVAMARPGGKKPVAGLTRCASLHAQGLLEGATLDAQIEDARARMLASGWTDAALEAGAISVAFDLWRGIAAAYASAYTRSSADTMPCGYAYAVRDSAGNAVIASPELRANWWSDASGIAPGYGVDLLDTLAANNSKDPALPGLQCLRALWSGNDARAQALHSGVGAARAALPRQGLPLIVIHGADDGLIPEAFSSGAYVRWAESQGRTLSYWRVANAQHFDAFLGLPVLATRYVPLMPYSYRALDAMWQHVAQGTPLPGSADIATTPRRADAKGIAPLNASDLHIP